MIEDYYAPRFEIRVAGMILAADITEQVLSVMYEDNLDLADMFRVVVRNADNRLLDSALFDLGKTVEIYMGYGNDLRPMMLGDITALEPSFPEGGPPTISISGYDKSYKMRHNQPDRPAFQNMNPSLIAAQIAIENGLIPVVDPSPMSNTQYAQTESDMAFLKALAAQSFFDVYVEWDRLYFQFPRPQSEAYVLEWGKNLSSFTPRISSAGLAGLQVIRGYNQELGKTIVATALAVDLDPGNLLEKLGSSAHDLLLSLGRRVVRKQEVKSPLDAAVLAKSILQNILEGLYEGSGSCIGLPELRAGKYVAIQGVGKRFSGTYRLQRVSHTIDGGGYRTELEISQRGHSNLLGLLRKELVEKPSPNWPERFYGVVVAEVVNNNEQADSAAGSSLGRVQVRYSFSDKILSSWAPCMTPMPGFYALPAIGDQVLVAFKDGNLGEPYVLGSLWNRQKPPPESNTDGRNRISVIKSRSGHTITFDDTEGSGKIIIQDSKGNQGSQITLAAKDGSVTISAAGNLTLKAEGTITLEAANKTTKKKTTITMTDQDVNVT